ncbi:MAG TPA: hypothetical protein VKP30_19870, partial [Polyangiaceae bacterium]|nr:hypothetical protein [Polyangiaceae bacterium]
QIWVMPGSHTVMMKTPQGEVSPKQLFIAAAGESIRITLSLLRAPALTPIQPTITLEQAEPFRILPEKRAQTRTIVGIVGGSLTAVAFGVAAWQGIRRYRLGRDIDDTSAALSALPSKSPCATSQGTPPPACADLRSQLNQFNDATRTTNALLAVSAGFGLATAAAYLLWPKESEAEATVHPQLSYEYQGLTLQGGF